MPTFMVGKNMNLSMDMMFSLEPALYKPWFMDVSFHPHLPGEKAPSKMATQCNLPPSQNLALNQIFL